MENNYLDRRVREALENLGPDFQAEHWEQMEQALNDPANADLSEQAFDHNLRHQLTGMEPALQSDHWDLFESQLDALETPEIEDVYLDGVTYELLNEMEVPYKSEHWKIMQSRLEQEFSLRQQLIRYKVAEMALFALAIFTLIQFLPLDKISSFHFPMVKKAKQTTPMVIETPDKTSLNTTVPSTISKDDNGSSASATASTTLAIVSLDKSTVDQANEIEIAASTNWLTNSSVPTTHFSANNSLQANHKKQSLEPLAFVEAIPATIITVNAVDPLQLDQETENQNPTAINPNQDIPHIAGLNFELLRSETPDLKPPCLACKVWKSPSFLRIGMVGTGDLNYVMTPYDEEYLKPGYNRFETGYGGGLTLGFKFGRWEIETGGMYASKYYNPDTIIYLVNQSDLSNGIYNLGYEGVGWEGTQLDLLRVPVRAKYSFTHLGKWQVYAQAGLALNMAMNRIHSKKVKRYEQARPNGLRSPLQPKLASDAINENLGMLNGGTFEDNHYFSADIGFGIERFLSPRFSIFTQPVFHYQLTAGDLGLNRERINNLSFEAGVRVSLKKNTPETH